MKKSIKIHCIALVLVCSIGGYYFWCSNHPIINIQIGDGGRGDNYKFEMPYATIEDRDGIGMSDAARLKLMEFTNEHERMFQYVLDNYKMSDIKLDIEVKDNQTILKYSGTAVTQDDEQVDFNKELACDFVLDINMEN